MIGYRINAQDPDGGFVTVSWATEHLPRVGDELLLPTAECGAEWQELTVESIRHYPSAVEVWLSGADGWDDGSVSTLFEAAFKWTQRQGTFAQRMTPRRPEPDELRKVIP